MFAIRSQRVFDGERFVNDGATVLVDDGRVVGLELGFPQIGEDWQLLDFDNATILPGLIDTHVHLVADSGQGALDRVAGFNDEEIDATITEALRRQLDAGVTTVRDLGDRRFSAVDRRDRQRMSTPSEPEPTILASGPPLTSRGGHCFSMGGEVEGRTAIAEGIRERAERRVDIVKVMASGGMATPGTDVMRTQFSFEDLRFLVDQAHAAGLGVTAHAHGLPSVEQAIKAGVDGIEHCSCLTDKGPQLSDELLQVLASSEIAVGGSLGAPPASEWSKAPPNLLAMMQRADLTPEIMMAQRLEMASRMYHGGVRLVTGADSGISPWRAHGLMHASVSYLVEAGAPALVALAAATSVAAQACGIGDRKGRLQAGYDADVIVVDGDLESDVSGLRNVRSVMLGGRLVR
jgi:imidazolonepropionase-like amidohydrolase